jgi:hypothetical protein
MGNVEKFSQSTAAVCGKISSEDSAISTHFLVLLTASVKQEVLILGSTIDIKLIQTKML